MKEQQEKQQQQQMKEQQEKQQKKEQQEKQQQQQSQQQQDLVQAQGDQLQRRIEDFQEHDAVAPLSQAEVERILVSLCMHVFPASSRSGANACKFVCA
jgi:hypothetical protein